MKAIAAITQGDETRVLCAGLVSHCLDAAKDAAAEIKEPGAALVTVFTAAKGRIFSDDGRKADYWRRVREAEKQAEVAESGLDADPTPPPPPAKKATKRATKKAAKLGAD